MSITGSLLTMPLAELLVWIQTSGRRGRVTVVRDGGEWELAVEAGYVTGYGGPELRDNLGHIVVTSGMLTEEDLRTGYQHRRAHGGTLQGALLTCGLLTKEELQECLGELATEAIYDLFIDLPGEFVFSQEQTGMFALALDDDEDEQLLPLRININHLLMEGARRQDEWGQLRERFPSANITVEIDHDKLAPLETIGVRGRRILASLDSGQSVSDICLELRASIPSVLRILGELEQAGAAKIIRPENADDDEGDAKVGQLRTQAAVMRDAAQMDEAIALLEVAVRMRPDDEELRTALQDCIAEHIRDLYGQMPPVRVPVVKATQERLQRLRLRPEERFLLNRLEAHMDVGSLIMVSSMSERETLKTLRKFIHSGVVELE